MGEGLVVAARSLTTQAGEQDFSCRLDVHSACLLSKRTTDAVQPFEFERPCAVFDRELICLVSSRMGFLIGHVCRWFSAAVRPGLPMSYLALDSNCMQQRLQQHH